MLGKKGIENTNDDKENNVPIKWYQKIATNIRQSVERIQMKNPKLFNGISIIFEIAWFCFGTFFSSLASSLWLTGIIASLSFGTLYFYQWILLTNKHEQATREIVKEIEKQVVDSVTFSHNVTHNIKTRISLMPNQELGVTREEIVDLLNKVLNGLEENLSNYYKHDICASIKLCINVNKLKTFARGNRNVKCRGGRRKVQKFNKKEIKIADNYAYNLILKNQLSFFAEGDLNNLTEKENDSDIFYCEYGEIWSEYFLSTIVIPIRYQIINGESAEYKMLGLICVDSKEKHPEWSNRTDNYGYQMSAFVADTVYSLIDHYMIAQMVNKQMKTQQISNLK